MAGRKRLKTCPGCGKRRPIRPDRAYCSAACANRHRATEAAAETTVLVFGDVHVPHQDPAAWDVVLQLAADLKPREVVINGDLLDCYRVSRFAQPGSPGPSMGQEFAMGRQLLRELRQAVGPRCRVRLLEGNHEFRLRHLLNNEAASLKDLEGLTVQDQLHLDELGVEYIEARGERWTSVWVEPVPGVMVGHFAVTRAAPGAAARALLDRYARNLIQGHVHSVAMVRRDTAAGPVSAFEGGCLCRLDPPYCEPLKWAHACHVIRHRAGQPAHVTPVVIDNGVAYFGATRYTAKERMP